MTNRRETPPTSMGIYSKAKREGNTAIEIAALILSTIWLVLAAVFFLVLEPRNTSEDDGAALRFVMILMAVFLPVAMIWVAATAARASQVMRQESLRLQSAIDAIRHAYLAQSQS